MTPPATIDEVRELRARLADLLTTVSFWNAGGRPPRTWVLDIETDNRGEIAVAMTRLDDWLACHSTPRPEA